MESIFWEIFSGFSCSNIVISSVISMTFSGLSFPKIVSLSPSDGMVVQTRLGINSIESIYSISLSGLTSLIISIWSTTWISFSGIVISSKNISSIYSTWLGSFSFACISIASLSSIWFSGLSCLRRVNWSGYAISLPGFSCLKMVNLSPSDGSVIHLRTESISIESIYSISFSGFISFNISIWSTICISFSGLVISSKNISSIYSIWLGSFSNPWMSIESLSSTSFSGFICSSITKASSWHNSFSGLGNGEIARSSWIISKLFHSNGLPNNSTISFSWII